MTINFDGQVAIVTGAGNGLGRCHALALAARGARVVVNDLGGNLDGSGQSSDAAQDVVAEIESHGGEAIANGANVTDPSQVQEMVQSAVDAWGRVDVLVNNAGILRDKSFAKMPLEDFKLVLDVHLMGTVICSQAVWPIMQSQSYGRIVNTSSPSGLYGQFGQSNYAAAKAGIVGLTHVLSLEGAKTGIRTSVLAPSARTRMTENLGIPEPVLEMMTPESITTAMLFLASREAPERAILTCAAGVYSRAQTTEGERICLSGDAQTPEALAEAWTRMSDLSKPAATANATEFTTRYLEIAGS